MGNVLGSEANKFLQLHQPFVRRVLAKAGIPEVDLDDVGQEVLARTARRLPAFQDRGEGAAEAWLWQICLHTARDFRRGARRRDAHESLMDGDELVDGLVVAETPEEQVDRARKGAIVQKLLEDLEPAQRAVLVAVDFGPKTIGEWAAEAGVCENTAWSRLRDARQTMLVAARRWDARSRRQGR